MLIWSLLPPSICSTMIWDQMITLWRVSEMKKWWFENSMNRGMMKSCKCWQWWFEEIKEPGQTGETNRIRRGLSQIRDPAAGAKGSHLWQPWNIRRTIAGFHCKPHFTSLPYPAIVFHTVVLFLPLCLWLTLKARRGQSSMQQCYEITHWPPCSLRQSGPIEPACSAIL